MVLLACLLASQVLPPEAQQSWAEPAPVVSLDSLYSYRVVAEGNWVISAGETADELSVGLVARDADGVVQWERDLPKPAEGFWFGKLELDLASNLVVTLLRGEENGQEFLRVEASSLQDGSSVWTRTVPAFSSGDFLFGFMDVQQGRIALASTFISSPPAPQTQARVLELTTGADLSIGPVIPGEAEGVTLAPSGNEFVVWQLDGRMDAFDAATCALLWSVDIPVAPTNPGGGYGVNDLEYDAAESRLIRTDGLVTRAFDAADGSPLWTYTGVNARDAELYGSDRVFVAGVDGVGAMSGATDRFAMLDVSSGIPVWESSVPSVSTAITVPYLKHTHAKADEVNGRIAFRRTGLFVLDAESGSLLGQGQFKREGSLFELHLLDNGRWAGGNTILFPSNDPEITQVFDGLGIELWNAKWEAATPKVSRPSTFEVHESGETFSAVQLFGDFLTVLNEGLYEERSTTDGSLLNAWELPFYTPESGWRTSPDGARLSYEESVGSFVRVGVVDTISGNILGEVEVFGGSALDTQRVWTADSQDVFTFWRSGQDSLRLVRMDREGNLIWSKLVSEFGFDKSDLRILWDEAAGEILLGHAELTMTAAELHFLRVDPQQGDVLGEVVWTDGATAPPFDYELLGMEIDPIADRLYAVAQLGDSSSNGLFVVAFERSTLTFAGVQTLVPLGPSVDFDPEGVAFSADRSSLAVAGSGAQVSGGGPAPVRIGVVDLPSLAPRFDVARPIDTATHFAQSSFLGDDVLAVRYGGAPSSTLPSAELELFSAESGASLASYSTADGAILDGMLAGLNADQGWSALLFGKQATDDASPEIQRLDVGPLLSSPDALGFQGGAVEFALRAGPAHAGKLFMLLGSVSGFAPPILFGGVEIPLVYDEYTLTTLLSAGLGPWAGSVGVLDAQGSSTAGIAIPTLTSTGLGITGYHAAIVFGTQGSIDFVSQPVSLELVP